MFNYEKFKEDIVAAMENIFREWSNENDDIYIVSLDLSRDMESVGVCANTWQLLNEEADDEPEDYWYYKYCEEEWELSGVMETVSSDMRAYVEENKEQFSEVGVSGTYEYTEVFEEHCTKMIESCKKALVDFRDSIREEFPDLLVAFSMREYLEDEERIEIFSLINGKEAAKEYIEHIEDFS